MKSVLLFLLFLFPSVLSAQFHATKDGFATEDGKDFYVAEISGKSAKDLYGSTRKYIMSNFKNPDIVSNSIENEMINMHAVFSKAYPVKKNLTTFYPDVDMNLIMYFKDGRIRFDIPVINKMLCVATGGSFEVVFSGGVNLLGSGDISLFNKNDKVKNEKGVEAINNFINNLINEIVEYSSNQSDSDW